MLSRARAPAPHNLTSESYEYWLRLQAHAPDVFDSILNVILEGENLGGAAFAAIYDG